MNQLPSTTSVVIAGGGPVGLAAAMELGTRGVECVVLEPREQVSSLRPRAKASSVRTMEHFRRWGLAERIRAAAHLPVSWSQDVVVCESLLGEQITWFHDCFGLAPDRREEFAESAQQVPQPAVEEVLREAVRELPSVTFATGWSLEALTESAQEVVVDAVAKDGTRRRIAAPHVLGCDGVGSRTREEIGVRLEGPAGVGNNLTAVFRAPGLARRVPHGSAVHYWVFNPRIAGGLGRFDLRDTWWGAVSVAEAVSDADVLPLLHQLVGEPLECEIICTDRWSFRMQLADTFHTERVFLVGDAAHQNPPMGGHGYNTGIGDAVDIGWKLAATVQGWAGPMLPHTYGPERRGVMERTIAATTDNMRAFFEMRAAFSGSSGEADPDTRKKLLQQAMDPEFHSLGLVLGTDYGDSPAVIHDEGDLGDPFALDVSRYLPYTRPGVRLPHAWLPDGRSLYDTLGSGLTFLRRGEHVDASAITDAAHRRGIPLTIGGTEGTAFPWRDGTSTLLVRPDQHIAWRGDGIDGDSAGTVLDRILCR